MGLGIQVDRIRPDGTVETMAPDEAQDYASITLQSRIPRVTAAAAFAVFMRPLDQLVINAGALVLGVWGVRAILLGAGVAGLTIVDVSLLVVILFLLVAIAFRTRWLPDADSRVKILRRRRDVTGLQ